jgi:UDP-N-acetylglucosamine 2-epimerase
MNHSGIAIVIGTKAELIKCMPVMLELQKQEREYWFIHTGQHRFRDTCEEFGIKRPDFVLSKVPRISTKFWSKISKVALLWTFLMTVKIRKILKEIKPRYVIYHGDTMSTSIAAIASSRLLNFNKTWENVHLETGLRSGNLFEPFPEEISRHISDRFSDILLAVSDFTEENLRKEKRSFVNGRIIKVGNTIVDSSLISYEMVKGMKKPKEEYVLINLHRHDNLRSRERMVKIVKILKSVKVEGIWPLHDNTKHYLEKYGLMEEVKKMKNIEITPLTNYSSFIFLLSNCKYLITDGGSIQEESLVFKKPCVILRKRTERQEGLETGINFLTGLDVEKSRKIIGDIESNRIKIKNFKNPYGERGVSKKIVSLLTE